jgi:uncharacterized protein (TIGR03086 family)
MEPLDLGPATRVTADVVADVTDDQLDAPTPCPDYRVADLVDHLRGLAVAFADSARKQHGGGGPDVDGSRLGPDWRTETVAALHDLAEAWRHPGALEGMTVAGPLEMPADVAALVALNEVVVHGWDLARATGQPYEPDAAAVAAARGFVATFDAPADDDGGLFGPPVDVPEDAPELHRLLGATGRRPDWSG